MRSGTGSPSRDPDRTGDEGCLCKREEAVYYEYLKATAIVNPHARVTLIDPDGNEEVFERATDKIPDPAEEILPHPEGD